MRLAVALLALLALAACDDMADQPKAKRYSPASQSAGTGAIPGAVARETRDTAPPPLDLALLQRGRERFDVFCSPCHGRVGDGDGMIVERGFPAPPSYHIDRLRQAPTQHFYDVITQGYGAMYSYAARVPPRDRWAIAAYIRALQASQSARLDDVPADRRDALR
jgi:mono/diheme cytochrome c family protein